MNREEYRRVFAEVLVTAPAPAVSTLQISDQDREFLIRYGLPFYTDDETSFDHVARGDFPRLAHWDTQWEVASQYQDHRVIGQDGGTRPFCIDESAAGAIYLHTDSSGPVFVNSGVQQLAASLLTFQNYLDDTSQDLDTRTCALQIQEIDPRAIEPGSYWLNQLELYADDQLSSDYLLAAGHSDGDTFPAASDLPSARWETETTQLASFALCGWNLESVADRIRSHVREDAARATVDSPWVLPAKVGKRESEPNRPVRVIMDRPADGSYESCQDILISLLVNHQNRWLKRLANAAQAHVQQSQIWERLKGDLGDDFQTLAELLEEPSGWLSLIQITTVRLDHDIANDQWTADFDCQTAWDPQGWTIALLATGGKIVRAVESNPDLEGSLATTSHPKLGTLTMASGRWFTRTDQLRRFSVCGWNEWALRQALASSGASGLIMSAAPVNGDAGRPILVVIDVPENQVPGPEQMEALDTLFRLEATVLKRLGLAIRRHVSDAGHISNLKQHLDGNQVVELTRLLRHLKGWLSLVTIQELRVSPPTDDGRVMLGCRCRCPWTSDEGMGIRFEIDRVHTIGPDQVGWDFQLAH